MTYDSYEYEWQVSIRPTDESFLNVLLAKWPFLYGVKVIKISSSMLAALKS